MKNVLPLGSDFETIPTQDESLIEELKIRAKGASVTPPKTKGEMGRDLELPEDAVKGMDTKGLELMWVDKFRLVAIEKEFQSNYRKTSFSATDGGEIISASFKMIGEDADGNNLMPEPATSWRHKGGDSEASLLKKVVNYLDKIDDYAKSNRLEIQFVGANVMNFDFRFLSQRCLINGVDLPKCGLLSSRYDVRKYFDVLSAWNFNDTRASISLDKLCKVLGVQTPKGDEAGNIHGGMVWDIWNNEGEDGAERIARYNSRDVMVLDPLYKKLIKLLGV